LFASYLGFLSRHRGPLAFGFLLMLLSSFGQTFFIALFGGALRASYGLSDGGLGTAYAVATTASALTLGWIGRWIDRIGVRRYTLMAALLLALACTAMAVGNHLVVLVGAFYMLRLSGQGLMVHTAQTATARTFGTGRGKALGFTGLGMALGEAALPGLAIASIAGLGWRSVWLIGAGAVILGTLLALACWREPEGQTTVAAPVAATDAVSSGPLWRDPRMLMALPAVLASPFISTGFFFHQARLAEEKGWSLEWIAAWFVGYAVARAVSMVAMGPVIDRVGALRLLPLQLVPLALAMLALVTSASPWAVPFYLLPMGLSAGIASTLITAMWVELYGPERLAEIRSLTTALSVLATGLSPTIMGWLIDAHVALTSQAVGCLVYTVAAGLIAALMARRFGR
jgi:MFS family permease